MEKVVFAVHDVAVSYEDTKSNSNDDMYKFGILVTKDDVESLLTRLREEVDF